MNTTANDYNRDDLNDIVEDVANHEQVLRVASDELQTTLDKLNDVDGDLADKLKDIYNEMRYFLDQAERRAVQATRIVENA